MVNEEGAYLSHCSEGSVWLVVRMGTEGQAGFEFLLLSATMSASRAASHTDAGLIGSQGFGLGARSYAYTSRAYSSSVIPRATSLNTCEQGSYLVACLWS